MAYQKSRRTQFNPADIRVNRGQSLSQFGSTYSQAAFKQVDEAQNLLDKKLDDLIEKKMTAMLKNHLPIILDNYFKNKK